MPCADAIKLLEVEEGRFNQLLKEKETLATEVHELRSRIHHASAPPEPEAAKVTSLPELKLHDPNDPAVLTQRIDELHQQLQELQIAHKSCVQELARTEDSNRELSEEKERLEQQNTTLRQQVERLGDSSAVPRAPVTSQPTNVRDELDALRNEIRAMKSDVSGRFQEAPSGDRRWNDYRPVATDYRQPTSGALREDDRWRMEFMNRYDSKYQSEGNQPATQTSNNTQANSWDRGGDMRVSERPYITDPHCSQSATPYTAPAWRSQSELNMPTKVETRDFPANDGNGRASPARSDNSDNTAVLLSGKLLQHDFLDERSSGPHVSPELRHVTSQHVLDEARKDIQQRHVPAAPGHLDPPDSYGMRSVVITPQLTQHNKHLTNQRPTAGPPLGATSLGRKSIVPRGPEDLQLNDMVKFARTGGKMSSGQVLYIGHLPGRSETYIGLELDSDAGKHDGTYEGTRFFTCKPNKGVFVQFSKVVMSWKP